MQQDTWTHSTTLAQYGTTGALGSPRSWLRRALDTATLDDTTFHPGSITPTEISVAGVWYQQPDGYGLPVTGMHRELFRYFEIPEPDRMMKSRTRTPLVPAIGIAAAVPMHEITHWLRVYKEHGAVFTWWHIPTNKNIRSVSEKPRRRQLDHAQVYKMLDKGMKPIEIGKALDFPTPNIDYVVKKWRRGDVLKPRNPHVDKEELFELSRKGVPVSELSQRFDVSPAYIYDLIKRAA